MLNYRRIFNFNVFSCKIKKKSNIKFKENNIIERIVVFLFFFYKISSNEGVNKLVSSPVSEQKSLYLCKYRKLIMLLDNIGIL